MIRNLLLSMLALLSALSTATGEQWNQFRGPEGNGHAQVKQLPLKWSGSKNVSWKRPIPGQGWSSPVLDRGRIYLTSAIPVDDDSGDLRLCLLMLDAAKGDLLREIELFRQDGSAAPRIHKKNSHASPSALIDGDRVFAHFGHQGTACVSVDGDILWKNDSLGYEPVHGNGGSPILVGDKLVFSCDGRSEPFIVALDKATGKVQWKVPRPTDASRLFSFSTPHLITVKGQQQIITPGSDMVLALSPEDGREIWRVLYDGYSVIPRPVFANGIVYICTGYDKPSLLAIRPDGRGDVTTSHVLWQTDRGAPHTPSLLVVGRRLYMISDRGVATALDARSGKQLWQKRVGGKFSASPVFAAGRIYLQDEDGNSYVIAPGGKYRQLAENSINERTLASLAVDEKVIFIRGEDHLFRIE